MPSKNLPKNLITKGIIRTLACSDISKKDHNTIISDISDYISNMFPAIDFTNIITLCSTCMIKLIRAKECIISEMFTINNGVQTTYITVIVMHTPLNQPASQDNVSEEVHQYPFNSVFFSEGENINKMYVYKKTG